MIERPDVVQRFGSPPRKIAVIRALQLGDLLVAVPALRAIRRQFPEAEITLIGLPWAAWFVERFRSYIDRFIEFPGYPGIDESEYCPERTASFLAGETEYSYDLVVQMHGSGRTSNRFALELGGRVTAGFYDAEQPCRLEVDAPYPNDLPEVRRNLKLAELIGCHGTSPDLEFPVTEPDRDEARSILGSQMAGQAPRVGIHPGAGYPSRRWPPEYFAAVADHLNDYCDAHIVLTGSPAELDVGRTVAEHMRVPAVNIAGETSLGGLAGIIEGLDLFISNDTGPAHIATALGVPSVVLFGPADPVRWAPVDPIRHRALRRPVACSPCPYRECPIDHRCLRWLSPSQVIDTAEELLMRVKVA